MLWYEKYRPKTFDDYVWTNEETADKLEEWVKNPLDYPHLLLTGTTGTGKTTLAKIIRTMLDLGGDVKFIPASLRSGVDTIRDEIVGFCEAGGFGDLKLIIMDEADRLSRDAQEMMRNVMDRYAEDVRFIFTCNNLHKIIDPVQGRMWTIHIEALDQDQFVDRLIDIADEEGVELTADGIQWLDEIVQTYYPNMRTAISELQRTTVKGVLTRPVTVTSNTSDLLEALVGLFENFSADAAHEWVAGLRPDQFEDVYRCLYQNSEIFEDSRSEAIITIAESVFRHSQAGLPDITLVACLIKLDEIE